MRWCKPSSAGAVASATPPDPDRPFQVPGRIGNQSPPPPLMAGGTAAAVRQRGMQAGMMPSSTSP
jgi:hypothetical protein